jgi:hypothetical protein
VDANSDGAFFDSSSESSSRSSTCFAAMRVLAVLVVRDTDADAAVEKAATPTPAPTLRGGGTGTDTSVRGTVSSMPWLRSSARSASLSCCSSEMLQHASVHAPT